MKIDVANGFIFLLYKEEEEPSIKRSRSKLAKANVIPIPCKDPEKFRFVTPEMLRTEPAHLDLIGRLALRHLSKGSYSSAHTAFVADLVKETDALRLHTQGAATLP
jgi:hypothetical protein